MADMNETPLNTNTEAEARMIERERQASSIQPCSGALSDAVVNEMPETLAKILVDLASRTGQNKPRHEAQKSIDTYKKGKHRSNRYDTAPPASGKRSTAASELTWLHN